LGALLFVNALLMLASPRTWFRLPGWIRAQGALTPEKYAHGSGAIQLRFTGAIGLSIISWVLYHSLLRPLWPKETEFLLVVSIIGWSIAAVVGIHMAINATFMLTSPRAWFQLPDWLRVQGPLTEQKHATGKGSTVVRFAGAILLAILGLVLYYSFIQNLLR
jgi:hypothetical protein